MPVDALRNNCAKKRVPSPQLFPLPAPKSRLLSGFCWYVSCSTPGAPQRARPSETGNDYRFHDVRPAPRLDNNMKEKEETP